MSRLIYADKAIDYVNDLITVHRFYHPRSTTENFPISEVIAKINEVPTIDAVTVVRCKDCIHRRKGGFSRSETDGWTVTFTTPCDLGDEGFCSKGEKVTE